MSSKCYYYYHSGREPTESIWRGEAKLGRRLAKLFIYQANYSILLHCLLQITSFFFLSLPKPMVLLHVVLLCKDTFQIVIKLPLSVFFLCIFFQMEYGYSCKCFLLETGKMDESQLRLKNAWQLSSCCARVSMDIMIGSKQTNTRSTVKKMASIAAPEE